MNHNPQLEFHSQVFQLNWNEGASITSSVYCTGLVATWELVLRYQLISRVVMKKINYKKIAFLGEN